jgi:hypothetical protein
MAVIKRYAHINQASNETQNKLDAAEAYITGSLQVQGEITGSSPVRLQSSLLVQGASQFDDVAKFGNTAAAEAVIAGEGGLPNLDLVVSGSVVIGDMLTAISDITGMADLDISGSATIGGLAQVQGNLEVQGEITGSGAVRFQNTLEVQGNADMRDVLPNADLTYDLGSAAKRWDNLFVGSMQALTVSAEVLSASVDADLNGTLHVEGASTFVGAVSLAQLTGSAGALFTAGNLKVEAGEVSASSDLKAGGQLVVAGNADLNGQLDVAGAAEFHSTLSASGNAQLGGTLALAGAATFASSLAVNGTGNAFTVAHSASISGDLTVAGDLIVQGEQVVLDTVTLQVEDKNIEIAKVASPTDITADGAGITIKGASDHTVLWYNDRVGGVDAFSVNDHWLPETDMTFDLGKASYRWHELFAGSGSFSGPVSAATLSASAAISGGSLATDGTLTVQGAADLNGGLDVVGAISASQGISAASFLADGNADFGSLDVTGQSNLGAVDAAAITATSLSASTGVTAASFTADGLGDFGSLDVSGNATLASLTASVGAEIQGPLSASSLVVAGNADFNGTATFNGTFAVPGTGNFGSLVVGGVSLSPISASLSTTNEQKVSGLEFSLADGQMIKLEVEAIAKGSAAAASFKYSIAARRIGAAIDVAAVEIVKEILGTQATGALMDVEITENGSKVAIEAKSTGILSEVKWNFQVVKMMKMGSDGLPVEPVAAG